MTVPNDMTVPNNIWLKDGAKHGYGLCLHGNHTNMKACGWSVCPTSGDKGYIVIDMLASAFCTLCLWSWSTALWP